MKGYNFAKQELNDNSELNIQSTKLLNLFVESTKTEFEASELTFDFQLLKERGELRDWGTDKLKLEAGDSFFLLWFENLKEHFDFKLDNDYTHVIGFIDALEEFYRKKRIYAGVYSLINRLHQWLIITLNQDFEVDFHVYTLSLNKAESDRTIRGFAERFGNALPYLTIPIQKLAAILLNISMQLKNEGTLNYPDGSVRIGLKDLVKSDPRYGEELLAHLETIENSDEYQALTLSALIEDGGNEYLQRVSTSYLLSRQPLLANAISVIRNPDNVLALKIYEITAALNLDDENTVRYVPSIYLNLIASTGNADTELKAKAFTSLTSIWPISKKLKPHILYLLEFIDGFENERQNFIITAFKDEDIEVSSIKNMHSLSEINSPDFINQLIEVVAERKKLAFEPYIFEFLFNDLERNDDGAFSKIVIQLLIHDNGFIRFAGSRLYTLLTFNERRFRLKYDLLQLPETDQIKIVIAVLTEMTPPQDCLANILKLLDSPYKKVVDYLLDKLKVMVESFYGSVTEEMKKCFVEKIFTNESALETIKEYLKGFLSDMDEKEKLNEFNPYLNEYELLKYYSETVQRKNSRTIKTAMNKGSGFMQFAKQVNLTKGGGWKLEGKDKVQQLGKFETSAPFPRAYFITPEQFDKVVTSRYLVTWKQIFEWEQIQL